ncbi:MAG TPA: acetylxylan esterase [Bryobacteraceae bacterium]|jgi:cephalosporin-C deacetylase-like acetyl esterase|nr:acetylxylan esterase [Bryobacteraceae bacterium]
MSTRRTFLEAASFAVATRFSKLSGAQPAATKEAPFVRDYWNDFPNYLTRVVNAARVQRKAELDKIKTRDDAAKRAGFVRDTVWGLIGGRLEKTPLNVKPVGTVDRGAYRIEKLIFESQPQFYVPANLYIPNSGSRPFPAVISPLGHTPNGKAYRSYQIVFQNLARDGFVVLTWDPPGQGERLQYPIPGTNRSRFGPTGEHDQFGWPALLVGSSTTQFETWDAVRALDYLLSRPEVDANRMGCCGHSGGGTQTMWLCALEPRIQAAVVVEGHTENVAGANYEPPGAYADAEQNIIGGLKLGIDRGDLLLAFAPKPLLICYTHMDVGSTYSPHYEQGTREIFDELKSLYSIYDAAEKAGLSASNLPHDYDFFHRRATYDWFNRWLQNGKGNIAEAAFDEGPASDLNCTSTGQILTSIGGRTAYQVNADRLHGTEPRPRGSGLSKERLHSTLRTLLSISPSPRASQARTLTTTNRPDLAIEEFEFHSEPEVRVPGYLLKPPGAASKLPVVLVLSTSKNRIVDDLGLLRSVIDQKIALCAIDSRASGSATPRMPSEGPLFYGHGVELGYWTNCLTAGQPLAGQRVWDALCCIDYLQSRSDIDSSRIGVLGVGPNGLDALFAAALEDRLRSVLLDRTLSDFASLVASEDYNLKLAFFVPRLLEHFDLPEVSAAIAPRPLWLLNPVDPKGTDLSLSQITERYGKPAANLSFRIEPDSNKVFGEWVRTIA